MHNSRKIKNDIAQRKHNHIAQRDSFESERVCFKVTAIHVAVDCTVGHKSHDPCNHVFLMEARVMTFVAYCTVHILKSFNPVNLSCPFHLTKRTVMYSMQIFSQR